MNQICSEGKGGRGGEAGAMVFAEVGNLIRKKNKNSHCAGETERGLRAAGGCGTPGWVKTAAGLAGSSAG